MAFLKIANGAEIRIKNELLKGRSILEIATEMGISYNSVAKRYRKLVEMGDIEDKVKHPYTKRLPEEMQGFLKLKKGEFFEYDIEEKNDCDFTVGFLNSRCARVKKNGMYGRFSHRWICKVVDNKARIIKIK